jgi:hypothetical protein
MKAILKLLAWAALSATVLCLAINPDQGAVYSGPLGPIGVGLIGLGMCRAFAGSAPKHSP